MLVALAGGLALQAVFLHCNQKGECGAQNPVTQSEPLVTGASELNVKGPPEKHARKKDFTIESPFVLISI